MKLNILHGSDIHGNDLFPKLLKRKHKLPENTKYDFAFLSGDLANNHIKNFDFETRPDFRIIDKAAEAKDQVGWLKNVLAAELKKDESTKDCITVSVNGNHDFLNMEGIFDFTLFQGAKTIQAKGLKIGLLTGVNKIIGEWHDEIGEAEFAQRILMLDKDIDILISHTAPYQIMDLAYGNLHVGSQELYKAIFGIIGTEPYFTKLKLHCFGHCHGSSNVIKHSIDDREIVFSNAAERWHSLIIDF